MEPQAQPESPREWRSVVERVLAAWSGYQLAVDFRSGGPETMEKHEWFLGVLSNHVYNTRSLKQDDLEQWMEAVLYHDFDLVLEDDSIYPTACFILEALGYVRSSDAERLNNMLRGLPTAEQIQQAKNASVREANDDEMEGIDEDMDDESSGDEGGEPSTSRRERQPRTVTDDDGWTTILKR